MLAFHQKVRIGPTFVSREGLDFALKQVRGKMTNLPKNSRESRIQAAQARVHRIMLDQALQGNGGSKPWQSWKASQAEEVVEDLVNRSPRMEMVSIQLEGDLSLIYKIQMPVPLAPQGHLLGFSGVAVFHLTYRENWRWENPPGWGPLGIFSRRPVWHPNVSLEHRGVICLGALPPSTRLKEIVLLGYYALTLQETVLDELDPVGVLNPEACDYYRSHPEYIPLCTEGLLEPWNGLQEVKGRLSR